MGHIKRPSADPKRRKVAFPCEIDMPSAQYFMFIKWAKWCDGLADSHCMFFSTDECGQSVFGFFQKLIYLGLNNEGVYNPLGSYWDISARWPP